MGGGEEKEEEDVRDRKGRRSEVNMAAAEPSEFEPAAAEDVAR